MAVTTDTISSRLRSVRTTLFFLMIRRPPRSTPLSLHDALPILASTIPFVAAAHGRDVHRAGAGRDGDPVGPGLGHGDRGPGPPRRRPRVHDRAHRAPDARSKEIG